MAVDIRLSADHTLTARLTPQEWHVVCLAVEALAYRVAKPLLDKLSEQLSAQARDAARRNHGGCSDG
jgi:hypothetical protein